MIRFLVDESTGSGVSSFLVDQGYDVFDVSSEMPGAEDLTILKRAFEEDRVVITNDKDFGELVFRRGSRFYGVILLRTGDESRETRIRVVMRILERIPESLAGKFVIASETGIRIRTG